MINWDDCGYFYYGLNILFAEFQKIQILEWHVELSRQQKQKKTTETETTVVNRNRKKQKKKSKTKQNKKRWTSKLWPLKTPPIFFSECHAFLLSKLVSI